MNKDTSAPIHGSLHGLRVVDLSRVLGGPYCGQILADHGADVLKIEPPQGDETRTWGPPFENGVASYYMGLNRNKRGGAVDLNTQAGVDAGKRLTDGADIVIAASGAPDALFETQAVGEATVAHLVSEVVGGGFAHRQVTVASERWRSRLTPHT